MCGILVYTKNAIDETELNNLRTNLKRRGPDYWGAVERGPLHIESSVLALRDPLTEQPLQNDTEALAYNGEIYDLTGNDSQWLWEHRHDLRTNPPEGEYAFAWYDGSKLLFGRDAIGRRSLVYKKLLKGIVVSSVSTGDPDWIECESGVVYTFDGDELVAEKYKNDVKVSRDETGYADPLKLVSVLTTSVAARLALPASKPHNVSVLFSGGLDCTFLAKILDAVADPSVRIELVNVAFENRRTNKPPSQAPDRLLAQRTYAEEFASSSRVELNLVDVSYDESMAASQDIRQLMYPSATVMDFSIALAFYFAAKNASSQILFSGLGADELFGGYARHERANDLASELELDFGRLGRRNLGRDDRVIAAHGKEMRYPYLDYRAVDFAQHLPLDCKRNKRILRQAATSYGIANAALEKKRAIQFGARTAKMDPGSGHDRGTDAIAVQII